MGALVVAFARLSTGSDAGVARRVSLPVQAPKLERLPAQAPFAASPRPRSQAAVGGRAAVNIPRLRLNTRIGTNLDVGPAWWRITGRPGGGDTIAVAGHRTTHTRPFYWLERLRPGDRIYVRWRGRVHAYRVSGRRILSAKNLHIADARGYELLLLSACTPRGSARQRIVVYAWPDTGGTES